MAFHTLIVDLGAVSCDDGADRLVYYAVCICGWTGPDQARMPAAREDGRNHIGEVLARG